MSPVELLVVVSLLVGVWGLVALAWFDLSQKVQASARSRPQPSEPWPETFLLSDAQAARAEQAQMVEAKEQAEAGRSARNWTKAR